MNVEIYKIQTLLNDPQELKNIFAHLHFVLGKIDIARVVDYLGELRDDLMVGVESEYVDAFYRDEYYRFYASKLHHYDRNCIRLSFFKPGHLQEKQPVDYTLSSEIKNDFLGFLVVRPLVAAIGRNVISPEALKHDRADVVICRSPVDTTALGLKVCVNGYPHSSQDGEMMACAETALWSITEYYGHKYSGYKLIMPSEILEAMRPLSHHRQLPSEGLTFEQISVGLCRFGFSTQLYSLYEKQKNPDGTISLVMNTTMKEVLSCYIESGFPLALCLIGSDIRHAVVCIGRQYISRKSALKQETIGGSNYFVWNQGVDTIVLSDDNVSPCQKADIEHPTSYYNRIKWNDVLLRQFMVPLPSRVYMDAFIAIPLSKGIMASILKAPADSVIRTFLASSRSFRNHIAISKVMPNDTKKVLLNMNLPRFVWISEISNLKDFQSGITNGLIILDATEPTQTIVIPLLLALLETSGFIYGDNRFKKLVLGSPLHLEAYDKNIQ